VDEESDCCKKGGEKKGGAQGFSHGDGRKGFRQSHSPRRRGGIGIGSAVKKIVPGAARKSLMTESGSP
jgi:hypothetical protein